MKMFLAESRLRSRRTLDLAQEERQDGSEKEGKTDPGKSQHGLGRKACQKFPVRDGPGAWKTDA